MIGGLGTALWFGLPESQNSAEQALTGFSPSNQVDTQRTQESGAPLARVRLPGILDLNHSTVEELQQLPGIGPVLAARIVRRRMQQGPFERVEDLLAVEGIGQRRLAQLADRIAVFPSTH
ncbi:MAG: hypothetical protein D6690_16930 [Nitrospirae bacterium]|nr:MAG: hypothetical protein D6690_16930 [Nitrospirota bacterium]